MLELIKKDTKYPSVSKALINYMADCAQFAQNNTYKLTAVQRYLDSFLADDYEEMSHFLITPVAFLQSLLNIVFTEKGALADDGSALTETELLAEFDPNENCLTIWSDTNHEHVNEDEFDSTLESSWINYLEAINQTENETFQGEKDKFLAFVAEFRSITANSNFSAIKRTSLQNLNNKHLEEAIRQTMPYFWGEHANMSSVEVNLDENMFDELLQLFLNQQSEAKHFIRCLAVATIARSVVLTPSTNMTLNMSQQETIERDCFYDALNPQTSSAIFMLYVANLAVRNNLSMTTVREQLEVRNIAESIRSQIRQSLMAAAWLQNDRQMLRSIDGLLNIYKIVGFNEEVYDEDSCSAELARFSGFYDDEDMIEKIVNLRASNVRFSLTMGSPDHNFELNAELSEYQYSPSDNIASNADSVCVDGQNNLPENIPDVEGARVAFQALKEKIGKEKLKERAIPQLSFTNAQMFFVAHAEFYCDVHMNDPRFISSVLLDDRDTHGTGNVRVNGVAMQMDEFRQAFSCSSEDRMVLANEKRCYLLPSV
uniref:Peptidase M13 C-terminal domain-containing protein n=1 Tax=Plectus sambesii TaxID=2011161 RepID=A0A914VUW4_9BILA